MSIRVMTDVFDYSTATLGARLVLLAIADCCDEETRAGWPSVETLARKAKLSERSVHSALRALVASSELLVTPRPGSSNLYTVQCRGDGSSFRGAISAPPQSLSTPPPQPSSTPPLEESSTRTVIEPSMNGQTERARVRARRWRVLPPDEQLSEARIRIGLEAGLRSRSQVERQWLIFRGHEFASPRSDVDRTWQNWCLKEADWKADEVPPPGPPAADPEKAQRRQQADVEYEAAKERSRQRAREADRAQAGRAVAAEQREPAAPERLGSVLSRLAAAGGKHADSA